MNEFLPYVCQLRMTRDQDSGNGKIDWVPADGARFPPVERVELRHVGRVKGEVV